MAPQAPGQAPEVTLTDLGHSSVLRPLSVLILAAGVLVLVANWLASPSLVRPAPILLTLVGATMWLLVRQGRPSWAAHVMCWGLAAGSWVGGYAAGGLWSVSWVAMPIACMASGWLLGQRTTLLLTCVGVLEAVSMFVLHWQGHEFNEQRPPATALIGIVVAMVSASLMSIMTMRALRQQVAGTLALQAQYHAMLQQTQQAIAQSRQQERDQLLQDMHDGFGSQLASARLLAQQGHLSPAQLRQAKQGAEAANQAKSAFLASMSHEIRTPMHAVLGFAQMLEADGELSACQQDSVQEIINAGRHLLALINEVLDLSRIESGKLELVLQRVELAGLVEECHDWLHNLADQKDVTLHIDTTQPLACQADEMRLKQVLMNLTSNAIKYHRPGGAVWVSYQAVDAQWVRLSVRDNGPGIAPALQPVLFQPFTRDEVAHRRVEGTGIGLSITKGLVERMGGSIGFASQPGTTEFWCLLPTAPAFPDAATHPHSPPCDGPDSTARPPTPSASAPAQRRHKVLCIDDDPVSLKLLERLLHTRGDIDCLLASTAAQGLVLACAEQPELVFLDIDLPDMDGYALLQALRQHAELASTPVIAISAHAMPDEVERGRGADFKAYITKPFAPHRLLQAVDGWLQADNADA